MARSSIFLMALAASLGFVAAAPVATEQRDIASDPAILAAYDANPKLAAMMGAPSPSKRALESDPAILAAYEANPKLAEMMGSRVSRRASSSNRIKARDETLAPIKVDDGRRNPRLPESIVDENGNGRVLPIVDYDNDGNTVTSWGDVTQSEYKPASRLQRVADIVQWRTVTAGTSRPSFPCPSSTTSGLWTASARPAVSVGLMRPT